MLIVDGMSTDETRAIVSKKSENSSMAIRLIDNPKIKTPFALNIGISHAKGAFILIASAHSRFDTNYISEIMHYFDAGVYEADIIGGSMETVVLNHTVKSLSILEVLSNKIGVGNSLFRLGVDKPTYVDTVPFGIYKTALLKAIGGYDTRLIRNHDIEMSKRITGAGYKILLLPTPKCYYYARETFEELFQNNYKNGYWNIKTVYITRRFASLSLRHFIPFVFLLSLILPVVASLLYPPLLLIAFLSLALYSIVILIQALRIKSEAPNTSIAYCCVGFLTLHFSYGLGSLVGLFSLNDLKSTAGEPRE